MSALKMGLDRPREDRIASAAYNATELDRSQPRHQLCILFFFNDPAPPEISPLSQPAALPIYVYYQRSSAMWTGVIAEFCRRYAKRAIYAGASDRDFDIGQEQIVLARDRWLYRRGLARDRKSTRLNSSHSQISYAVFCLKKTIS